MPELPEQELRPTPAADRHIGRDVSAEALPGLQGDLPDGGVGYQRHGGDEDADADRAADAIFRADAERLGYIPPNADGSTARRGLNRYYRDTGLMPERGYRLVSRYEIPMSSYYNGEEYD